MVINKLKNILVLILISLPTMIYALGDGGKQPKFRGTVKLPGNVVSSFDSICVMYNPPYSLLGMGNDGFYLVSDKDGKFEFTLPRYAHPNRVQISVKRNRAYIRLSGHYLVEQDDDITIDIVKHPNSNAGVFSGHGAEKYNVINKLDDLEAELLKKMHTLKFHKPDDFATKLLAYNRFTDTLVVKKESILNHASLSKEMKKILMYEFGNIFYEWAFRHYSYYRNDYKDNAEIRALISANYNANKQKFSYPDDAITSYCSMYLTRLSREEGYTLFFSQDTTALNYEGFYNRLKNKYTGLTRQLLLSNIVLSFKGLINEVKRDVTKVDSLQNDAYNYITLRNLKEVYTNNLKLAKGKKLFAATFVDENGNQVTTESLKGKVVFIDMWNVGCGACMRYHESFHKNIYPLVKNNKDFVYLSIGNDDTKEEWIQGIKGGRYTSPNYLNVNANYMGLAHPFAKNYDIRGLPFVLLVDKSGNIHSSILGDGAANDLKLINEALAKP